MAGLVKMAIDRYENILDSIKGKIITFIDFLRVLVPSGAGLEAPPEKFLRTNNEKAPVYNFQNVFPKI